MASCSEAYREKYMEEIRQNRQVIVNWLIGLLTY